MTREHRLTDLLVSLFPTDVELRHFLFNVSGSDFCHRLPGPTVPLVTLAMDAVVALGAWGLITDRLWAELREQRPGRLREIQSVRGAWSDRADEPGAWLAFGELCQLANLVLDLTEITSRRDALFAQIAGDVRDRVPIAPTRVAQTLADLDALNQLTEGEAWLRRWLENARVLAARRPLRAAGIDYFLACVASRSPMRHGLAWTLLARSDNPILRGWTRFTHPLQHTLAVASSLVREEVQQGLNSAEQVHLPTKFFFAALRALQPEPMATLLKRFPQTTLEEPRLKGIRLDAELLVATPTPSPCLCGAIERLLERVPPNVHITPGDVFVDLAKYGTGESVEELRRHQVDAAAIDRFADEIQFRPVPTSP